MYSTVELNYFVVIPGGMKTTFSRVYKYAQYCRNIPWQPTTTTTTRFPAAKGFFCLSLARLAKYPTGCVQSILLSMIYGDFPLSSPQFAVAVALSGRLPI